jgi:Myb-like DNA-binding domain
MSSIVPGAAIAASTSSDDDEAAAAAAAEAIAAAALATEAAAAVAAATGDDDDDNGDEEEGEDEAGGDDDDDDATEEAAAAAAANKWSKNGFGAPVLKQSGKFSKDESECVRKSVEDYCAAKQISTARLCSECDHKAELKGAWMEIAKRLPHRSVQSVYRHGIRQLHPFKRGAWSEAECTTLVELVARLGKKWSTIQGKLHRSADACRDKYREMSDDYVKGRWKEEETETLKRLIREQLGVDANNAADNSDVMDMAALGKMVEEQDIQIPWSAISKRMGKRSRLSCFKKWQKLTGMFSPETGIGGERHKAHHLDTIGEHEEAAVGAAEQQQQQPPFKRLKSVHPAAASHSGQTAGAAAAAAAQAAAASAGSADYEDIYSAKMADETVEAVGLPDTDALPNTSSTTVREI